MLFSVKQDIYVSNYILKYVRAYFLRFYEFQKITCTVGTVSPLYCTLHFDYFYVSLYINDFIINKQ